MKKNLLLSSVLGCMLMAAPASADVIGMRTAVPVGQTMSIALNQNVKATLAWGDGSNEEILFKGAEVKVTVKHADLTITTDKAVTNLFCPDCALTELDLKEVPHLATLACADNHLEKLDLNETPKLVELNCEGNKLASLLVTKCPMLTTLNCAYNQLSSLNLSSSTNLTTLMCGYNKLTGIYASVAKDLQTVWCQGNNIQTMNFATGANPVQICAFDNEIRNLNPANLAGAKELWLDNNQLSNLDLTEAEVTVLSASNNKINQILMEKTKSKALEAFYVDQNELIISSLPNLYSTVADDSIMHYNISNQRPYHFTDKVNVNEKVDMIDVLRYNAIRTNIRPTVEWITSDGVSLVSKEDYTERNYAFTFLKPYKSVGAKVTSKYYPGEVFFIENFQVYDPTGIGEVSNDGNLKISAKAGLLQITVAAQTPIRVYTISGATVINEVVAAGSYAWALPAGVYVVNGHKVVLNH